jgi:non-specific serine/threonine protein kinase
VVLFIDRATAVAPSFAVTKQNAVAVAQICQRLDGIPLALELAAARVKSLPVEAIAARMEDSFRLLTGGSRTALPRQQTLRASIDWSHDLLSEPEQVLLRRLSVFAGGWTLEAAEAVCGDEGCWVLGVRSWASDAPFQHPTPNTQHLTPDEVLDVLTSLVDKSLVVYEEGEGEGRYRLLEALREYARERLEGAGEHGAVRGRHRDWFLGLAEVAAPSLFGGAELPAWMDRLEIEHDNLRAALECCGTTEIEGTRRLRLAGALWRFWDLRGYLSEGREWLEEALRAADGASPSSRARALLGAGILAGLQGDDTQWAMRCAESLALFREVGDRWGIAWSLDTLGVLAWIQGDAERAAPLLEEALAVSRDCGDKASVVRSLMTSGIAARSQGDEERARARLEEALVLSQELGDQRFIAWGLYDLGLLAVSQGDYGTARARLQESLCRSCQVGDWLSVTFCLDLLAEVWEAQGQPDRAARLMGAAEALRDARGARLSLRNPSTYDRIMEAIRAAPGAEALASAWAEGRAMTEAAAVAYALEC